MQSQLLQLINYSQVRGTRLLYRATRDGFRAEDFHRLCDNRGPTLTVIRSDQMRVFGGFTDIAWSSPQDPKNAQRSGNGNSFLFTVD